MTALKRYPHLAFFISRTNGSDDYHLSDYQVQVTDSTFRFQSKRNGDVIFYDEIRDTLIISLGSEPASPRSIDFYRKNGDRLDYKTADMMKKVETFNRLYPQFADTTKRILIP